MQRKGKKKRDELRVDVQMNDLPHIESSSTRSADAAAPQMFWNPLDEADDKFEFSRVNSL